MSALVAEAVALCEAAQQHFEEINEQLQRAIQEGRQLTRDVEFEESQARKKLYVARTRLADRLSMQRRLTQDPSTDE